MENIVFKDEFIDFNIARTLSIYNNLSATGKTYFPIVASQTAGFPFIVNIRNDVAYKKFIDNPWFSGDDCIYFFDRCDMFGSEELYSILISRLDICSILDLKNKYLINKLCNKYRLVNISRPTEDKFEVRNGILF